LAESELSWSIFRFSSEPGNEPTQNHEQPSRGSLSFVCEAQQESVLSFLKDFFMRTTGQYFTTCSLDHPWENGGYVALDQHCEQARDANAAGILHLKAYFQQPHPETQREH
jgi:hypothetical protein